MSAIDMGRMVYGGHSAMKPGVAMDASWGVTYWLVMFFMWWVMMAAMMLPSAAPTILLAAAINRKASPDAAPFVATSWFTLGYLLAWGGFSLGATAAQWTLEQTGLLSSMTLTITQRWLGGSLLLATAAWQFSPLKQACLACGIVAHRSIFSSRGEAAEPFARASSTAPGAWAAAGF